jgi:putative AlgH/UPF0301 family transcriptional regulator
MKKDCRKLPKLTRLLNRALLISLLVCGFFLFEVQAQQKKKTNNVTDGCEIVTAKLGEVLHTLSKIKDDENYLIIIGKSAANVKSGYVRRQVDGALKYFNFGGPVDKNKIVLGFDKSSNKFSQLQFFVGGKLVAEINYHPKAKLCFSDGWTF